MATLKCFLVRKTNLLIFALLVNKVCSDDSQWIPSPDMVDVTSQGGHKFRARNILHCSRSCSKDHACVSFFYISGLDNNCHLHDTVLDSTATLTPTPNSAYYTLKVHDPTPSSPTYTTQVGGSTPSSPTYTTKVSGSTPSSPTYTTQGGGSTPSSPTYSTQVGGSTPSSPTDTTQVGGSTPSSPTDTTQVGGSTPSSPTYTTQVGGSTPSSPTYTTQVGGSTPSSPTYTTQEGGSTPSSPTYTTQVGGSTPSSPTDTTQVGGSTPSSPTDTTQVGGSTPSSPTYTTQVGGSTPSSPTYTTQEGGSTPSSSTYTTQVGGSTPSSPTYTAQVGSSTPSSSTYTTQVGSSTPSSSTYTTQVHVPTSSSPSNPHDPTSFPEFSCPPDDTIFRTAGLSDGNYFTYRVMKTSADQRTAIDVCESQGGYLARVTTIAKMNFLIQLLNCTGYESGDYFVDGESDSSDPNNYFTSNEVPIPMTTDFWCSHCPDGINEFCVRMSASKGHKFNDIYCDFQRWFICEKNSQEPLSVEG